MSRLLQHPSRINLDPTKITPEKQANINVKLKNSGDEQGTKEIDLQINGEEITREVQLGSEQSKTITLEYTPQKTGTFNISTMGKSTQLKVVKPANFTVKPTNITRRFFFAFSKLNFRIKNQGGFKGTKTMNLSINNDVKTQKEVTLAPEESKIVKINSDYTIYDLIENYASIMSDSTLYYIEKDTQLSIGLGDYKEDFPIGVKSG